MNSKDAWDNNHRKDLFINLEISQIEHWGRNVWKEEIDNNFKISFFLFLIINFRYGNMRTLLATGDLPQFDKDNENLNQIVEHGAKCDKVKDRKNDIFQEKREKL